MSTSETLALVALVVVALLAVAAVAVVLKRRARRHELQELFGSEYDRTVEESDKRREAERELAERRTRHDELQIRPLSAASRQRYLTAWDGVQNRFIDSPVLALSEADALLTRMLAERGFPTDDVRTQEDMLSVEHAHVLEAFRKGHAIEQRHTTGNADTEQVRQGMLHFRQVFEELVSEGSADPYPMDTDSGSREREHEDR